MRRTPGLLVSLATGCLMWIAGQLPAFAQGPNPALVNALWVGETEGVLQIAHADGSLLLEIPQDQPVRAVAVDSERQRLWIFTGGLLRAFAWTGEEHFEVAVGLPPVPASALGVHPGDGSAWVAAQTTLVQVDEHGQILRSLALPFNARAIAFDTEEGLVWVGTQQAAVAVDEATGVELLHLTFGQGPRQLRDLAVEGSTGNLWVALQRDLLLFDREGEKLLDVHLGHLEAVAVAGGGEAWVADRKELLRVDEQGQMLAEIEPFGGQGVIDRVAADAETGTVWAANQQSLGKVSAEGELLLRLDFEPPIHIWDLALYLDLVPPVLEFLSPVPGVFLADNQPELVFVYSDVGSGVDASTLAVEVAGGPLEIACEADEAGAVCLPAAPLPEGEVTLSATVADYAGNLSEPAAAIFTVDTIPPQIFLVVPVDGSVTDQAEILFQGTLSEPVALTLDGEQVDVGSDLSFAHDPVLLTEGPNTFHVLAVDPAGNVGELSVTVTYQPDEEPIEDLPPDPKDVATPIDPTVATDIFTATEFLYAGEDPIQREVEPDTIEARRVAVLRGRVLRRDGGPLPGAEITIHGHPEYGHTLSRLDGMFDLAVNGGGYLTVSYEREGFLPVHRRLSAPWRDFAWVEDVVMIPLDSEATVISSGSPEVQVAQGSPVADDDGERQATVVFPAGVSAEMVLPDGSTQPLPQLSVRATEYTVGEDGPRAMPAELPANTGYTYAVELSADEAMAAGARTVTFSEPVFLYVENFLDFPTGGIVPIGYYDRELAAWIPSDNGRVVRILGSDADGLVEIDLDGSGNPAPPGVLAELGFTDGERARLTELYEPETSLWRSPIPHFTPWDCNWPYGPPLDAEPPIVPEPERRQSEEDPCEQPGSVIECENQVLGESIPIVGTPFSLNYTSSRFSRTDEVVGIFLSGEEIPPSLKRIELVISVSGSRFQESFSPAPNRVRQIGISAVDAYGREVRGSRHLRVEIGYVYDVVYHEPADFIRSFGRLSGNTLHAARRRSDVTIWRSFSVLLSGPLRPSTAFGLGGWTLSAHHVYDGEGQSLWKGSGRRRSAHATGRVIDVVRKGNVTNPLAVGPDGSLYFRAPSGGIHRLTPLGEVELLEGIDSSIWAMTLGPDGSLYLGYNRRIDRLYPDGTLEQLAGGGDLEGDDIPALEAKIGTPLLITIDANGQVYFVESFPRFRIRGISRDGNLTTVAGQDQNLCSGNDGPASEASLGTVNGISVGPDQSVYIAERCTRIIGGGSSGPTERWGQIRRIRTDGIIELLYGRRCCLSFAPGNDARRVMSVLAQTLHVEPDGSVVFTRAAAFGTVEIYRITPDGIIRHLAGNSSSTVRADFSGVPALRARIDRANPKSALGPGGEIYFLHSRSGFPAILARVGAPLPGFSDSEFVVLDDRTDVYYSFDRDGRHLATVNLLTGVPVHSFHYNSNGQPSSIIDAYGNLTGIERASDGESAEIISPDGHRTMLKISADGFLAEVVEPGGATHRFEYSSAGLLTARTDPRDNRYEFSYDEDGLLIGVDDPSGGSKSLTATSLDQGRAVTLSTALGRETTYVRETGPSGEVLRRVVHPTGRESRIETTQDGARIEGRTADGTEWLLSYEIDPRYRLESAQAVTGRMTPGPTLSWHERREFELATPGDPSSVTGFESTLTINQQRTFSLSYDHDARRAIFTTPEGRRMSALLDQAGSIISLELASLAPLEVERDERGRTTAFVQTGAKERRISFEYDEAGWLDRITDPLGSTVEFTMDPSGRVVRQVFPDGRELTASYGPSGNLVSLIPPGRPAHEFDYTPIDQVGKYSPPAAGLDEWRTRYLFDLDRQLTTVIRPDGAALSFDYDSSGRLSGVNLGRGRLTYGYDIRGRLAEISTPAGDLVSYSYSGSLLTGTSWGGTISGTVTRGFDANLWLRHVTINGTSRIDFDYDLDGLLTEAGHLSLTRHPDHGLLTGTSLQQVTTDREHNAFGEIERLKAMVGGDSLLELSYERDASGRIVSKEERLLGSVRSFAYVYDLAGRLVEVHRDGALLAEYGYDANGNRIHHDGPFGAFSAVYDDQDRLVAYGDMTFTYTANGELVRKSRGSQTIGFDYDELGNLLAVTLSDGREIEYVVDGANRRVGKKIGGELIQGFLYHDALNPVAELDGEGNLVSLFVYGSRFNIPDYMVREGSTYRILSDHLGSSRLVIDVETGEIVQQMDYDEFGQVILDTNPGFQPFGFAGGLYDRHTGLIRFGIRDYDPETGRWTTKDPILFASEDSNLYAYVGNDPVNAVDLTGLQLVLPPPDRPSDDLLPPLPEGCTGGPWRFDGFLVEPLRDVELWGRERCQQTYLPFFPQPIPLPRCICRYRRGGLEREHRRSSVWRQQIDCDGCPAPDRVHRREEDRFRTRLPALDVLPRPTKWTSSSLLGGTCFAPDIMRIPVE